MKKERKNLPVSPFADATFSWKQYLIKFFIENIEINKNWKTARQMCF